ncbi:hypothetical protein LJC18_04665 [Lachnospiraceae bacterium OttesenSCG-928-E19]|nr:hypothetical protein [Lachnospiraceae bacterium OttesenSCG-928-E19]
MGKTTKIENAYNFIAKSKEFTLPDLVAASGWTSKTAEKSLWKIGDIVERKGKKYSPIPNFRRRIPLTKFRAAFSQTRLRKAEAVKTDKLIAKSKNAVLSAVQTYNTPLTTFRTENFIILMTIGFTSLFHAIFEKNNWPYIEAKNNYLFGLEKCFNVFNSKPEKTARYNKTFLKSLEALFKYFKQARDLIEHQINDIDDYTSGHCQSWLFCYEHILKTEFGEENSLNTMLASAIQFSDKFNNTIGNKELDEFHSDFYETLSNDIKQSPFFKLKIRIIPYQNIKDEDFRQNAIFVSDPVIAAKYAEMDKTIFVATPKNIPPTDMAELVKPIITQKYGNMKFVASHLAKIAVYMGWIKNGEIKNHSFMSIVKISKKSGVRQYKEGAEKEIEKAMNKNPDTFLKSFATREFYENWKKKRD